MWAHHDGAGSRLPAVGFCLGAVALLYGGSFYTRDWRPAVHQAGQPVTEQSARPTKAGARPMAMEAMPSELPARVAVHTVRAEPEVTGALPKGPEPLASPPTAATTAPASSGQAGPSSEAPPPRVQAQATAPRPAVSPTRVHHARLRTERAARQQRVRYARLRAQPVAWRQTAQVRASKMATASRGAPSPTAVASRGSPSPYRSVLPVPPSRRGSLTAAVIRSPCVLSPLGPRTGASHVFSSVAPLVSPPVDRRGPFVERRSCQRPSMPSRRSISRISAN